MTLSVSHVVSSVMSSDLHYAV